MLKVPSEGAATSPQTDARSDGPEQAVRELAYQMAYGLSHELNNPLANIAARGRLLAETEPDPHRRQQLAAIVDQAMRGCEMIADLMLFARPPQANPVRTNIQALIAPLVERARLCTQGQRLSLELHQTSTAATEALVDPVMLEESLWALIRNAVEAARARIDVDVLGSDDGSILCIEIVDDGPGLSTQALQMAFHPFFSGREAGRGIGLGLSKAQRLIEMNSGTLTIQNESSGCRVRVEIPACKSEAQT